MSTSPFRIYYTDVGLLIAVVQPSTGVTAAVELPIDTVLDQLLPTLLKAIDAYAAHRDMVDDIDTIADTPDATTD
ncbi:MAG: hypothetical protein SV966_10920 [Actinomycetota bacterium]|nr:hypothetical protein [Actinomycetota bacterium]